MPLHPALIVLLALTFLVAVAGIAVVALLRLHRVLILQQYRVHLVRQALEALEEKEPGDDLEIYRLELLEAGARLRRAEQQLAKRTAGLWGGWLVRWMGAEEA